MSPPVEMLPLLNRSWKFRFLMRLKRVLFDLGCTAICRSGRPRGTPLRGGGKGVHGVHEGRPYGGRWKGRARGTPLRGLGKIRGSREGRDGSPHARGQRRGRGREWEALRGREGRGFHVGDGDGRFANRPYGGRWNGERRGRPYGGRWKGVHEGRPYGGRGWVASPPLRGKVCTRVRGRVERGCTRDAPTGAGEDS